MCRQQFEQMSEHLQQLVVLYFFSLIYSQVEKVDQHKFLHNLEKVSPSFVKKNCPTISHTILMRMKRYIDGIGNVEALIVAV